MQRMSIEDAKQLISTEAAPGSLDMIAEVRRILQHNTLANQARSYYDTHRYIIDAEGKAPEIQRHYLNLYWGLQLVNADDNSIEERYCLVPNGNPKDWLVLFEQKIVPFLIKNNLPKSF